MKKLNYFLSALLSAISLLNFPSFLHAKEIQNKSGVKVSKIETKDAVQIKEIFDKKDKNNIFIDVREPFEWKDGIIPNSLKISLGSIPKAIEKLDKNKNYILVCRSGNRSSNAAKTMKKAGFNNLTNFQGGMISWNRNKFPITK
ncbi:MAG: rhodanese-like domain-containing protein [Cyanobacteriota bacterium]